MNILFNCLTLEKGGAERVISILANKMSADGENVTIVKFLNGNVAYDISKKIKIRVICNKKGRVLSKILPKYIKKLRDTIVSEKPDVIISFLPEPSLKLMLAKKFYKDIRSIPTIISIRNDPAIEYKNPLIKKIVKKLYRKVDGMVYQTEDAKKFFNNIVETKNQTIIPNPIDESALITPQNNKNRKNIIISVGRLEEQKNHELTIKAFKESLKKIDHNYILKIYGEGSERQRLQNLISELNLKKQVFLEGQVDNIMEKLNESKIFILSSKYEGMPNALMEAMAMGLACISTDCPCGGPNSLIKSNENGILVETNDMAGLNNAIIDIVLNNDLQKKLAQNSLKIRKTHNILNITNMWRNEINNVIGDKK